MESIPSALLRSPYNPLNIDLRSDWVPDVLEAFCKLGMVARLGAVLGY